MKSFIFGGDTGDTPESLKRKRAVAEAMMANSIGRVPQNVGEGLASIGQAIAGRMAANRLDKAEAGKTASADGTFDTKYGVNSPTSFPAAPASDFPAAPSSASASIPSDAAGLKDGIASTARSLGIDPVDLATAISYETAGTFDPSKKGPTTQWGQHRGLIQFGEPQAAKYGVNWDDPVGSQLGPRGAIAKYLLDAGVKPGMGMMDVYSAINAGHVGRNNASDANNGGAPGTVADKVTSQMAGHRAKALAMFGDAAQGAPDAFAAQPGMAATASPALGYADGARIDMPMDIYDKQGMRTEAPAINPQPGNRAYSGPGARTDAIGPNYGGTGFPAPPLPAPVEVAQAPAVAGNGATDAPSWLPEEFQNSEQLRSADPNVGILRALTGRGAGTGLPQQEQQAFDVNGAVELMNNPYLSEGKRAVLKSMIERQMSEQQAQRELQMKQQELQMKQNDPAYKLDIETKQANLAKLKNPTTDDMREYEFAKQQQGYEGSFVQFMLDQKKAGAASTVVNTGEGDKFYQTLDTENAKTISALSSAGMQAQSKLGEIDRLDQLMANAPQGAVGALKQAAGEWGIATEGLSDIQAATALIDRLVPQQRPVGSGQMSDGDVKLFRGSLPRIINQPGGNQLITQTLRGIAQYEIETGNIADRVANREISPAEGRKLLREVKNPLAGFKAPAAGPTPNEGWTEQAPGVRFRKID